MANSREVTVGRPIGGKEVELSIVMPCLNEAETVGRCIDKAREFLKCGGVRGEVVVGDNGSTDGSQAIAREHGARVVEVAVKGYGAAIAEGVMAAKGRYVIIGDSDDSYDFSRLEAFLERLRGGDDVVIGNRFAGGIQPGAMPFKNRWFGNPALTAIGRLFFRSGVRDFHCGLRGCTAEAFRRLELRTTGMEFASEMIIKATLKGMRVSEVPTTLSPDGRSRPPHLRPWKDGWRHLRFMLLYSPRWLFLYPGLFFIVLGMALVAWLFPSERQVGEVTLDVHTLLYASMMILLGFQSVAFAAFAKVFAISEGLLPPDPKFDRLFQYVKLETGLLFGGGLVLLGATGVMISLIQWERTGFGPLEVTHTMRLAIVSALLLTVGVQTIFSSFFLSVLGLRIQGLTPPGVSKNAP